MSRVAGVPGDPSYLRGWLESDGLHLLARHTGGLVAAGPVPSARALEAAAAELDTYYSIGYSVGNEREGPRNIEVRPKNKNHRVRARKTVVPLPESDRLRDRLVNNLYLPPAPSLESPHFDARVDRRARDGRYVLVHLELTIHAGELLILPDQEGKQKGSFSVFAVAGRELGDAGEVAELQQDFVAEEPSAGGPVQYTFAVRTRPDTRRLSIAVRDNLSGGVATKVVELE